MVQCLPETGAFSATLFTAPLLLVRGLSRRAVHWIIIHHQRHLQKLSVRRRRHQSLGNRSPRPCSEPLMVRDPHRLEGKIRPRSDPSPPCPLLEDSGKETHDAEVELEVHVSAMHVPVQPLLVLSHSFSWARVPPLHPTHTHSGFDDRDLSSQLGSISLSNTKRPLATPPGITRKQSGGGHVTSQKWPSAPGSPSHSSHNTLPEMEAPQELAPPVPIETNLPSVSLGDGECIRLIPLYQMILEKPYFHLITRPHAKRLVMNGGEGTFLIRPSTRSDKPLTLTLKHDGRYYNINIRQRPDTFFALGNEKDQEQTFSSIDEIVNYHHKEPIKLENGECALLKYSPSKQNSSIYVRHGIPSPIKR